MDNKEEFRKKILATFRVEAEEGISEMVSGFIELEKKPTEERKSQLIEATFRNAHSLKGAARAVNNKEIESICQALEGVFHALKNKIIVLQPEIFEIFHLAVNLVKEILNASGREFNPDLNKRIEDIIFRLSLIENGKISLSTKLNHDSDSKSNQQAPEEEITIKITETSETDKITTIPDEPEIKDETIRISVRKLDVMLYQVEEMLSLKLASAERTKLIKNIILSLNSWEIDSYDTGHIVDKLQGKLRKHKENGDFLEYESSVIKMIEAVSATKGHLKVLRQNLYNLKKKSEQDTYDTGLKTESLMEDIKSILTVPFSTILNVFPKVARDLAIDQGKKLELTITGDDIEIDRRILENIRIPLMHILRNCIDHGIERPDLRKLRNKTEKGSIRIVIDRFESNKLEISISDDGNGINTERIKEQYIKNENLSREDIENIDESVLIDYIFTSGVTTNEIITDLSGRGLGLAIAKEKVEQLGGSLSVKTAFNLGTTFIILLPLSQVSFGGVLIKSGNQEFILATSKIDRIIKFDKKDVKTIKNRPTLQYNNESVPLVSLADILKIKAADELIESAFAIIISMNGKKTAFAVDEVIDEEMILVKKFNKHLAHVRNISGATVLGSGKVIPILAIPDLFKSAMNISVPLNKTEDSEPKRKTKQNILVVEDSITSRTLLKSILETAGYQVMTAVDGIDGITKAKEIKYDLIVSDIDMPRMNGFDLTSKIRSDKSLADLPVILVTSLSKKEDKEHGMEVGANAYIIKSSFDQSNLLEVVRRLI